MSGILLWFNFLGGSSTIAVDGPFTVDAQDSYNAGAATHDDYNAGAVEQEG